MYVMLLYHIAVNKVCRLWHYNLLMPTAEVFQCLTRAHLSETLLIIFRAKLRGSKYDCHIFVLKFVNILEADRVSYQ